MAAVPLQVGLPLSISGRMHSVTGWHKDQIALLPDGEKEIVFLTTNQIANGIADQTIELRPTFAGAADPEAVREKISRDLESLSDTALRGFERRRGYINAIRAANIRGFTSKTVMPIATEHARKIGDTTPPHFSTLYRWHRDYKYAGFDSHALIPNFHKRGNRSRRLHHLVKQIIDEQIEKTYLLRQRPPVTDLTVAEAVADYLSWFKEHHKSAAAVTYKCNATILPHFGHRKVEELTPPQIRAWHEAIANTPRTRHVGFGQPRKYMPPPETDEEKRKRRMTANGDLTALKAILNFAYREGKVTTDAPWRAVQAFRGVHRVKAPYLTLDECQRLIPLCAPDFRLLVCGALFTGARLMELVRMTADDYDPRAGTVHFAPGKTRWARHVILTEEGQRFFFERVQNLHPSDLVFRRQDGESWRAADACHRLRVPAREAGLGHISFHIFRHTYASLLAEQGTNMAVIAKNLGHRQTEVVEKYYAHLSEGYVAKEIRSKMPLLGVK